MAALRRLALFAATTVLLSNGPVESSPDLGQAEGQCRAGEAGPALVVEVVGLKDRRGLLKLEVYPPNDADFLQDDNILINSGKVFRRVEQRVAAEPVTLCIRIPAAGAYSVVLLHDRDANRKFSWMTDGVGFAGNPRIGWSKPRADAARVQAGSGLTRIDIVMNYHHGFGMSPVRRSGK